MDIEQSHMYVDSALVLWCGCIVNLLPKQLSIDCATYCLEYILPLGLSR